MRPYILLIVSILSFGLFSGCATTNIAADSSRNPPPAQPLNKFASFELAPLELNEAYQGQEANTKAFNRIQENLENRALPVLQSWDVAAAGDSPKLLIKPYLRDIKFVNATSRVWVGALAGKSAVVMEVELVNAETGEVIARPQFYQHADAHGGAWSFGATDNNMLQRVVDLFVNYLYRNYSQAVGGPTGKPTEG